MKQLLFKLHLLNKTVLAVTGHRALMDDDWSLLTDCVRTRLEQICERTGGPSRCVLITALAPGADQLVAEVARALGIPLYIVLPMALPEYRIASFEDGKYQSAVLKLDELSQGAKHIRYLNDESISDVFVKETAQQGRRQELLIAHAELLAGYADHLIALWDGNDTGRKGGTSHVVRMARSGRDDAGRPIPRRRSLKYKSRRLHHLVTRRTANPFPMGHVGDASDWDNLPYGTDAVWHTSVLPRAVPRLTINQHFFRWVRTYREPLIRYGVPALLFVMVVLVGHKGYKLEDEKADAATVSTRPLSFTQPVAVTSIRPAKLKSKEWSANSWFKAVKFIYPDATIDTSKPNIYLVWGRGLGALFFLYTAIINLIFLFGDSGVRLFIWFFWFPKWVRRPSDNQRSRPGRKEQKKDFSQADNQNLGLSRKAKRFNLICGLTEKSYDLFLDLQAKGERVLILDKQSDQSPFKADCISRGGIVLNKDPLSDRVLKRFFFRRAKRIFVMTDSEADNVRISQQLFSLLDNYPVDTEVDWFTYIWDIRMRAFLAESISMEKYPAVRLNLFNLYENIARQQLQQYPLDRFYLSPKLLTKTHLVVFGFGQLAEQLVLHALRLGQYDKSRRLYIQVYVEKASEAQAQFLRRFPVLIESVGTSQLGPLRNEVFMGNEQSPYRLNDVVCFSELDENVTDLMVGGSRLFQTIRPDSSTSFYFCLDEGLQSAALMRDFLPRLEPKMLASDNRIHDVQAFLFYNFPNQTEEYAIEAKLNELFPDIPITFFGNFLETCAESVICRNPLLDDLPKLINWHYQRNFGPAWGDLDLKDEVEDLWRNCNESDKESNRLAADHLWVKYRLALAYFRNTEGNWEKAGEKMHDWLTKLQAQTTKEAMLRADPTNKTRLSIVQIPWQEVPPVEELADVEHRRWAVEKLLAGLQPLLKPSQYEDTIVLSDYVARWNDQTSSFKKETRRQRVHLDMVPTSVLNHAVVEQTFRHLEKYKDIQQVRGMALFFDKLKKSN